MALTEIKFYSTNNAWGEFSNFALYEIVIKGKKWPTSEHYFQARKFEDNNYKERIRKASSPMKAAELGRSRKMKLRKNWNNIRDNVMYDAVFTKFTQHGDLKQLLLSTADAILIEHTENDSYWGDGGDGKGKNKLGKILMKVRENLSK